MPKLVETKRFQDAVHRLEVIAEGQGDDWHVSVLEFNDGEVRIFMNPRTEQGSLIVATYTIRATWKSKERT